MKEITMLLKIDPLLFFLDKYGYDSHVIKNIVTGEKYTAVVLNEGQIGVCANLGNSVVPAISSFMECNRPDLTDISHRIIFTAYLNACHNYHGFESQQDDIFDVLDFSRKRCIVMIGYFKPIVRKFEQAGIALEIFDMIKKDKILTDNDCQEQQLNVADTVILTSTSVFNGTFLKTINATPDGCSVYLLGPSSIMLPEMLQYKNVKMVFGATFEKDDSRVLSVIQNNGGDAAIYKIWWEKLPGEFCDEWPELEAAPDAILLESRRKKGKT